MSEDKMVNSDQLWLKIISEGVEDRVQVNQRMLIDKMLARYSSDFVVLRELIQNSDDAQSTSFTLQISCDPSSSTQTYESINKNNLLEGLGQLIKSHWGSNEIKEENQSEIENNLNNCIIKEIRTRNNGQIFTEDDWKRVITIAEGNTNVDAIGQFGVGFFSVFSYSEKPIIQSGKHCLAFAWQNGKSLTTFRKELSLEEESPFTSIILNMKNKFILQTKSQTNKNKSKKNSTTNEIVPTLDLTQLKAYVTKVLSFTKYINELIIEINGFIVFQVNKTIKPLESNKISLAAKRINSNVEHNLLRFNSVKQTEQIFCIKDGPQITLNHIDVQAQVIIDKDFHKQIQGVLKKSLPEIIHIEFLFPSNNIFEEEQWKTLKDNNLNNRLLKGLIPFKFDDEEIVPSGQIFIGLATHQSTGIGMHVFTHLIPTIERENIDLQDPYISIWNEQLLTSIGIVVRFIYDETILNLVNNGSQQINNLISPFAFQPSAPNKEIGRIIVDGFFSSDKDLLVPVRRSPCDNHLSLIPSTEAYLTNSKHIQTFLPIPLVPFELGKNEFFKTLKTRRWIEQIDNQTILVKIAEIIFSFDELIGLLRWLCTNDINQKSFIKQTLSKLRYRETRQSALIQLEKVEFYDALNKSSLPLPPNVLPSNVVAHISREDLEKRLSLSSISVKNLIEFYLMENQHYLFKNEDTSTILLSFISQHWNQLNETEINKMKNILSNIKCIPTTKGMKSPNESYVPSTNFSSDLSIITLFIPQISTNEKQEYSVSMEFIKSIGCRTIHIPTITNHLNNSQSDISQDNSQTLEHFIQHLLEQRKNLSSNDINALKHNQCISGITLDLNFETKHKYKPCELHFPSVANRLQWNQLPIIDWINIDPHSQEYSFLKELGVKEVTDLNQLIKRIDQEHQNTSKTINDYKLPNALKFFAEHFQQHYSKWWKNANIQIPFLPSISPFVNKSTEVILTTPDFVFKESSPLCPSLLPDVLQCFSEYFDIGLIGVKQRPQISMAFQILMEKRNQLLNVESASIYFSYFNKLDGLNKTFIQNISNRSFIPLSGTNIYVKPCEVFIRSNQSCDDELTRGLIDYVDYGSQANSFLQTCGVLHYPSAQNLAHLLIQRQSKYFQKTKDENEDMISSKLRFYTNCLKQLASIARELNVEPLRTTLISNSWCLAYQIIESSNGNKERIFRIVKPNEIYLDDDHQSSIDLKPLCAPDEPDIIKLYELFGSKWLSENVKRTLVHRGKVFSTDRSNKLHERIHHRLDMLFVNNRGESMENIDQKRIELLRNNFVVYESEGIQCQLIFQNKTISLNSSECSSCALENEKNKVILYIHKDISTLDYIDIATELTRFVYKKALDTLVHSISDKLSSPLETLKRRGIPVDRLLKTTEQPIKLSLEVEQIKLEEKVGKESLKGQGQSDEKEPLKKESSQQMKQSFQSQQNHQVTEDVNQKLEEYQQSQRGFFQSLKGLLISLPSPSVSPSLPNNPISKTSSTVERDRIHNFGQYKSSDDNDINRMIGHSRPYSGKEFNQSEHSINEINNSCEFVPSSNMIRYSSLLNGIPLYIDMNVTLTNLMIEQGKQLSYLLCGLAKEVFNISIETMHLFRDIDSARIAFNSNGSLFYNLRYFEQVYWDDVKPYIGNNSSSSIVRRIVNFYYMVTCHELSHNIDSNHDLNFINRFEKVSVSFMDTKDVFLNKFYFK